MFRFSHALFPLGEPKTQRSIPCLSLPPSSLFPAALRLGACGMQSLSLPPSLIPTALRLGACGQSLSLPPSLIPTALGLGACGQSLSLPPSLIPTAVRLGACRQSLSLPPSLIPSHTLHTRDGHAHRHQKHCVISGRILVLINR